jgi:poly(hydroxyalkanoate) granule-associated protein
MESPITKRKDKIMAKKQLKKKVQAKAPVSKLGGNVVDSARDIWLAGLGAFSVAQHESGKLVEQGNKLFDKLVSEGKKLEKSTRGVAESTVDGLRSDVESRVDSVRQQAVDNWDKLEGIFEERVARVLGRMGVPTADDVNKLSARVQKLSDQVAALAAKKPVASKPVAKKPVAKKPAAKKPAAKKAVSKKTVSKKAVSKPVAPKAAPTPAEPATPAS